MDRGIKELNPSCKGGCLGVSLLYCDEVERLPNVYLPVLQYVTRNTEVSSNMGTSTISIPNDLKAQLNKMKIHHRETYADVIVRLITYAENAEPLSETEIA